MSNKKYKDTYVSELYNIEETIEILKKCPADIYFKLYHKVKKELDSTGGETVKNRITLAMLAKKIDTLNDKVDTGFKQVNTRLDNLETRVDHIEKRLDYNELKPLPDRK